MTNLYSAREHLDGILFTKFDRDLNPEATYLLASGNCECPAGQRPTCKHRKMLPMFLRAGHVGDGWFLDWDTRMWRGPVADAQAGPFEQPATLADPEVMAQAPTSDDTPVLGVLTAENGAAAAVAAPEPPVEPLSDPAPGGFQIKRRRL